MENKLKEYIWQDFRKSNIPKYYKYFDEWYNNLTDNQKYLLVIKNDRKNMLVMGNVIFKCYSEADKPQNMLFLGRNQIKKITPKTMHDGRSKLFVEYYDDWCIDTMLICEEIVTIDPDIDEDYKIWRNS